MFSSNRQYSREMVAIEYCIEGEGVLYRMWREERVVGGMCTYYIHGVLLAIKCYECRWI